MVFLKVIVAHVCLRFVVIAMVAQMRKMGINNTFEDWISNHLDPTLSTLKNPTNPPTDLIWDLANPDAEREFLEIVGDKISEIYKEVIQPNGNVLHIRKLAHYLYSQTVNADTSLKWTDEDAFVGFLSGGFDYSPERSFVRQTAIPLAVAASVVVMLEGSREDLSEYEANLGLELSKFEHVGAVPPLSSADEGAGPGALTAFENRPSWTCASQSVVGKKAVEDYYRDNINGRVLLQVLFTEKSRCEFQQVGMPTDELLLTTLGKLEAQRLESVMRFLNHGDVSLLEKEVACANKTAAPLLAPENEDLFAARCDGTMDSDFDGVVDQFDKCATPRKIVQAGYLVDVDGCAFSHESDVQSKVSSYILGTVKK